MKPSRCAVLCSIAFSFAAGAAGCARPAPKGPDASRAAPSPRFESSVPEASPAQRRAQAAWCAYLEALYQRATADGSKWRQLDQCNAELSTASPEMLERTAACSQKALEGFPGDPFTAEYAAEVKRCGTKVLQDLALSASDLEPYVALACQRGQGCAASDPAECRAELSAKLGAKLGRAVGALNAESRIALRQCLQAAGCQDGETRLTGCLEPILDRLLWTPE